MVGVLALIPATNSWECFRKGGWEHGNSPRHVCTPWEGVWVIPAGDTSATAQATPSAGWLAGPRLPCHLGKGHPSEWQLALSLLVPCNPKLTKVQAVTIAEHQLQIPITLGIGL